MHVRSNPTASATLALPPLTGPKVLLPALLACCRFYSLGRAVRAHCGDCGHLHTVLTCSSYRHFIQCDSPLAFFKLGVGCAGCGAGGWDACGRKSSHILGALPCHASPLVMHARARSHAYALAYACALAGVCLRLCIRSRCQWFHCLCVKGGSRLHARVEGESWLHARVQGASRLHARVEGGSRLHARPAEGACVGVATRAKPLQTAGTINTCMDQDIAQGSPMCLPCHYMVWLGTSTQTALVILTHARDRPFCRWAIGALWNWGGPTSMVPMATHCSSMLSGTA